ncbi:hypothetical protein ACOI1C_15090 [Bacillus sp. DJP31]|uniref:hypothetical protein n=1 Tax=Bacillus sp. DJP31 TaxID=3409789 RepID=UPI003BB569D3
MRNPLKNAETRYEYAKSGLNVMLGLFEFIEKSGETFLGYDAFRPSDFISGDIYDNHLLYDKGFYSRLSDNNKLTIHRKELLHTRVMECPKYALCKKSMVSYMDPCFS